VPGALRVNWVGAPERPTWNIFLPLEEGLQTHYVEGSIAA
jgi:hypothetical protein